MSGPVVGGATGVGGTSRRERAQRWLRPLLGADLATRLFPRDHATDLPDSDRDAIRVRIDASIGRRGGTAAARQEAAVVGATYLSLDAVGRRRFLDLLAQEYGPSAPAIQRAIDAWHGAQSAGDPGEPHRASTNLRAALRSPRVALLQQFTALPDGVKLVVDMRAELLRHPDFKTDQSLAALEADVHEMLDGWFNIGLLELKRITWQSPAALLEKLIAYEAVHAISSWDDLRNRLDPDRRCFAFVHPAMPGEPLIFVEVALTTGLATAIAPLLDQSAPVGDPRTCDTAIFYGISNCQAGLAGVSFGDVLIKRVVEELRSELPNLGTFATLSPMPGFAAWLSKAAADEKTSLLSEEELTDFSSNHELIGALTKPGWVGDAVALPLLEGPLVRLGARYLATARHRDDPNRALDSVAHFHLANGARLERINFLGNPNPEGIRASFGLMCNYRYDLQHLVANHEAYESGRVVTASSIARLLEPPKPRRR